MKFLAALLVAVLSISSSFAIDQGKLDEFKAQLTTAIQKKDLPALNKLFCTDGASEYQVDMVVYSFQYSIDRDVFDSIEFQPLSDPKINPAAMDSMLKGQTMNGHTYVPNIKPETLCSVKFRSKDGNGSTGHVSPVGIAPDGSVKFVMMKRAN